MFSDPVVGADFYGRQEILDLLFKRANALKSGYRQNVALIGHQQLGKTSVLRQFLHTYRDPGVLSVYVEIKFQALDYFVDQFIRSLLYQCLAPGEAVHPMEDLTELSRRAEKFVPRTVDRIREITRLLKNRSAEVAYARLFELTSILKEETGKNCIVILDEFHRLGEFGLKNAFSDFGKRIMVQKDTMYLLSSSSFTASRKILAEKLALLFGNFERIYLEPFDFETCSEFLDKKLSPAVMSRPLKYFLIAFTDGHPFFLETTTRRIQELANARGESEVSRATVAEVFLKLLFESQGVLNQYFMKLLSPWLHSASKGRHVLILAAMAKGTNKLKEIARAVNRSQREVSAQIQELVEHELILKTGVFYRFHNKIFKFWLREVYEKKELSLLGTHARSEDFKDRVLACIAEYEELLKLDVKDRVVGLMTRFRNEMIEIGEKKRRLPHFTEWLEGPDAGRVPEGSSRSVIARGNGRCWVCKIVEEKATEKEILQLVEDVGRHKKTASPTSVLVALKGLDENARLLAKEKRVLTLGLSRINMLMDVFGDAPIVQVSSERS